MKLIMKNTNSKITGRRNIDKSNFLTEGDEKESFSDVYLSNRESDKKSPRNNLVRNSIFYNKVLGLFSLRVVVSEKYR